MCWYIRNPGTCYWVGGPACGSGLGAEACRPEQVFANLLILQVHRLDARDPYNGSGPGGVRGEEDNTISQLRQLILLLPVAGTKQTLSRDHTPSLSYQAQNPAQRSLHSTSTGPKPGEAWESACQPWARALGGFVVQCTRLLKETGVL